MFDPAIKQAKEGVSLCPPVGLTVASALQLRGVVIADGLGVPDGSLYKSHTLVS